MSENSKDNKKQSAIDKIIMGAIIGTAVGSAVGASMAPKKGSETRKIVKETSQEVGSLARETGAGFLRLGKTIARRAYKKVKKTLAGTEEAAPQPTPSKQRMRQIPLEGEIIPSNKE